jgi:hypothetical protein
MTLVFFWISKRDLQDAHLVAFIRGRNGGTEIEVLSAVTMMVFGYSDTMLCSPMKLN